MGRSAVQGIIFDMDNTLLRSHIDFEAIKRETFRYLAARGIVPPDLDLSGDTTSTLIDRAVRSGRMSDALLRGMWDIPTRFEIEGMQGADLEPGAADVLSALKGKYRLAVVTNNAAEAAETALQANGIRDVFDCVAGRETMVSLKPAPDGFRYVLDRFVGIAPEAWLSVGDSWIDGKASAAAGIPFVAYKADPEQLRRQGVCPRAEIADLRELLRYA